MTYRALDIHAHFRTGERKVLAEQNKDADKQFKTDLREVDPVEYYAERNMMARHLRRRRRDGEPREDVERRGPRARRPVGRAVDRRSARSTRTSGPAAIRELERIHELGAKGVKLQPITQAFMMNDPEYYPIWDACQQLGLPLIIHTGHDGDRRRRPGWPRASSSSTPCRSPPSTTSRRTSRTSRSSPPTSPGPGTSTCWRWPATRATSTSTCRAMRRSTSRPRSSRT